MGKGNDPNCLTTVAMIDAREGMPQRKDGVAADWDHLDRIHRWPRAGSADIARELIDTLDNDEIYSARQLLETLPAGDTSSWREALDGYRCPRTGYTVRVPWPLPFRDGGAGREGNPGYLAHMLMVFGSIHDGDRPVGDISLSVTLDPDGNPELRIGTIELRHWMHGEQIEERSDTRLGGGFGSGFVAHLEEHARRLRVPRISLHAVGGGCYAWASMGFVFDPRHRPHAADAYAAARQDAESMAGSMRAHLAELASQGRVAPEASAEFARWCDQADPPPVTPRQLAAWGEEFPVKDPITGRSVSAGRAAIYSRGWHGVKPLT
jgi:hypothetical protein